MALFKKTIIFSIIAFMAFTSVFGQSNPTISVLPTNSGVVVVGASIDLQITIGNTGPTPIAVSKLRPVITVPALVSFLSDANQLPGLPPGWTILSNTGSQLRICNTSDIIEGQSSVTLILKVQGVNIGGPSTFTGQMNFGNGTTCAPGAPVSGNITADDISTSTITVIAGCSLSVTATAGTILCNGENTTITINATGVTGAIEYSLTGNSPFQASNVFTAGAGTYNVTARQVSNPTTCVASTIVNITEPTALSLPTLNIVQPTCTNASGIITITSPTAGLTFSLDGGNTYNPYSGIGYSLATGNYSIIAKNNNNCISSPRNFTVNLQPVTPAAPMIGTITQPTCSVSTGSIILNNLPSGNWIIEPGNFIGNTSITTIPNLPANTYAFTVTNSEGCTSLPSANVVINAVVGAPNAPTISVIQPTCITNTGEVVVTSSITGLTFSLDGGTYASYPTGGYIGLPTGIHTLISQNISGCLSPITTIIINAQPAAPTPPTISVFQPTCNVSTGTVTITSSTMGQTFNFNNGGFASYPSGGYIIEAGTYTLLAQNSNGCNPTLINNIIVNPQPASPVISATFSPITCFGNNSTITAFASGGSTPYEFSLNGGSYQTSNQFTVSAGSYFIMTKDSNGCTASTSNISITQPIGISATASVSQIKCNGDSAVLSISAIGGVGGFEYSLNNGIYKTENTFKVAAGNYIARVRLINNPACFTTLSNPINVTQPDILKATASAKPIISCGGTTTVTVIPTGGKSPYMGIGNFTRGPGKWVFVITDSSGCTTNTDVTILPPGCIEVKVFPNPAQNSIYINHSAAIGSTASIQIYTASGVRVLTKLIPQNTFKSEINISILSSGTYMLVYNNDGQKKETKFIKVNK